MNVLIAVERRVPETYVDYLVRALEDRGVDVECSAARVLRPDASPTADVVHVHWPEELCGWQKPSRKDVDRIGRALDRWKREGAALVVTRHNAVPHAHRNDAARELYRAVLSRAAAIVHLGRASHEELTGAYDCRQVVIPHGNHPDADPVERRAAREELGIDPEAWMILVFGAVRHFREKRLVLRTFRRLPVPEKACVVPRWSEATRPSWLRSPLRRIADHLTDRRARTVMRVDDGRVDPRRVGLYFGAADVVFIPRFDALNSGVLPLAYSHGRAVVGPRTGNLTELLEATGNFVYRPGDPEAASSALAEARRSDLDALGRRNRAHAEERWGWEDIARRHRELYRQVAGAGG